MTNEEIQEEAERVYAEVAHEVGKGGSAVQIPLIADALRRAASKAYEEAARKCDELADEWGNFDETAARAYDNAAKEVRALKAPPASSLTGQTEGAEG